LVDWIKSELPKQYFNRKLNSVIKYLQPWAKVNYNIGQALGIDDARRNAIREYKEKEVE